MNLVDLVGSFFLLMGILIIAGAGPLAVGVSLVGGGIGFVIMNHRQHLLSQGFQSTAVLAELRKDLSLTRYQVPSFLLLLAGVAIILAGFHQFPYPFDHAYEHEIEYIGETVDNPDHEVLAYRDLSSEGKQAFQAALNAPDNQVTVYGGENKPPEFLYTSEHPSTQYIQYRGKYYFLRTQNDRGVGVGTELSYLMYALVGSLAAVVGGLSLGDDRPIIPSILLFGLGALWAFDTYNVERFAYELNIYETHTIFIIFLMIMILSTIIVEIFIKKFRSS